MTREVRSAKQLAFDPAADHSNDVFPFVGGQLAMLGDLVVSLQAGPTARSRCMLRDEYRVTSVRGLPTVVARLRGGEPLGDDVVSMRTHRGLSAHHRDRSIAVTWAEVELRPELLAADAIEPIIDGCGERRIHAES